MPSSRLVERRRRAERLWRDRFSSGDPTGRPPDLPPLVQESWERSAARAAVDLPAAPVDESTDPVELWRGSPLRPAVEAVQDELVELAEDRGFVAAVMDDSGRLLWTAGGRHMRRRAEQVNFAPGGRWDEGSVGTNALALAFDSGRPAAVFSAEHYAAMVHGWCCFAAPLRDPVTGRSLGVLDISSTWDRAHPMALAAVRALALAAQAVLDAGARERLDAGAPSTSPWAVQVMGSPEVRRGGLVLPTALRQAEVLALLALHPDGLTPEGLHDRLHGDRPVSLVTTKADVSHLRALLDGGITRRRYRLDLAADVDVVRLMDALRHGRVADAAALYRGPLLPSSDAPGVREWREVVDVALRDAVLRSRDAEALAVLSERVPFDVELQRAAVGVLGLTGDPRHALARGRLARAENC